MQENAEHENSDYGHFSRIEHLWTYDTESIAFSVSF